MWTTAFKQEIERREAIRARSEGEVVTPW